MVRKRLPERATVFFSHAYFSKTGATLTASITAGALLLESITHHLRATEHPLRSVQARLDSAGSWARFLQSKHGRARVGK